MRIFKLIAFLSALLFITWKSPRQDHLPTVELKSINGNFILYRNGEPYYIKGAGGHEQMEKVALYGGNSIRTWNTQEAGRILDEAHRYGLTVTLGLEVGKQFWGDDFSYWNFKAVNQKITELKKVVEEHKDHPALLMWNVGNEVNLFGGNRLPRLYTMERIARMIKETDPNHPVMTSVSMGNNFNKLAIMQILTPNIDILGVNAFKKIHILQEQISRPLAWKKAVIITEWGPPGPWEVDRTRWKVPIEPSSTKKADYIENFWQIIKEDSTLYLGNYAFYWGHKYERTSTFFSLFTEEGLETESVNVLRNKWSPGYRGNQAPKIDSMQIHINAQINEVYLSVDSLYQASVFAWDPDGDSLSYRWEIRPEGYDNHIAGAYDYPLNHLLVKDNCASIQFRSPTEHGPYRLFVYVYDGQQHIATQNIPFFTLHDFTISKEMGKNTNFTNILQTSLF